MKRVKLFFFLASAVVAFVIGCTDMETQPTTSPDAVLASPTTEALIDTDEAGIDTMSQPLYAGPNLKLPLQGGYKWKVNVEAGTGFCSAVRTCDRNVNGSCCDTYHTGAGYYSIDFGRTVRDSNGNNEQAFNAGVVDVLAAASGTILNIQRICQEGDPNPYCPVLPEGLTACSVEIDHGNGYTTQYFHFSQNSIPAGLQVGNAVEQGQFLGKMGNTGTSCGTAHLHFQVTSGGNSRQGNAGLSNVALEGVGFLDHTASGFQYGAFRASTNTLNIPATSRADGGVNPRTCSGPLALVNGNYTCTRQSDFQTYRKIYSDILVYFSRDFCYQAEVTMNDVSVGRTVEQCTNYIPPFSSSYLGIDIGVSFSTANSGPGKFRYFMRAKDAGAAYLSVPIAEVNFTVLGNNGQAAPVIISPPSYATISLAFDSLQWRDAQPNATIDHDLYFYSYRGNNVWGHLGFVNAWAGTTRKVGLPLSNGNFLPIINDGVIVWIVRSCNHAGCSNWSIPYAFLLTP